MTFNTNKPERCFANGWCQDSCVFSTVDCITCIDELNVLEESGLGYEVDDYFLTEFNRNTFDPIDILNPIIAELGR